MRPPWVLPPPPPPPPPPDSDGAPPICCYQDGKLTLLRCFKQQLAEWGTLLRRFLRSEDDQVELLLTCEEFCSEEGVFEGRGEQGAAFAEIFVQVRRGGAVNRICWCGSYY